MNTSRDSKLRIHANAAKTRREWTLRFRMSDRKNFDAIRRGLKTVETRAVTERYRKIEAGDRLVFSCSTLRLTKKVKRVSHFRNIGMMFRALNYKKVMPLAGSSGEVRKVYGGYPGYKEKIRKFGIVALWLG